VSLTTREIAISEFNVRAFDEDKKKEDEDEDKKKEFDPTNVAMRIKDALEIVKILFENKKYVLGIAILASAHESFLKASIMYAWQELKEKSKNNSQVFPIGIQKVDKSNQIYFKDSFFWDSQGLKWKHDKKVEEGGVSQIKEVTYKNIKNPELLKLVKGFIKNLKSWGLLKYICSDNSPGDERTKDDDLRNQFMHNLRGATKEDVILYISGQSGKDSDDLIDIYESEVVKPFHEALKKIGLWDAANLDDRPSIQDRLDELIKDLDNLA
jgi:hypothetical protein